MPTLKTPSDSTARSQQRKVRQQIAQQHDAEPTGTDPTGTDAVGADPTSNRRTSSPIEEPAAQKSWMRRFLVFFMFFAAIWVLSDFLYSSFVRFRYQAWESKIERDEQGVLLNCRESVRLGDVKKSSNAAGQLTTNPKAIRGIYLLHGINDTPFAYRKMIDKLHSEKSEFTWAIRLPGFGEPIEEYRNSKLVDWQAELKRHLKKKTKTDTSTTELGLEKKPGTEKKRYLIAHSLGGALAINTLLNDAQQNELQVDGLVLLAPAIEVSNIRSPIFPTRFWHELTGWTMFFTTVMESPFPADTVDPTQQEYPERIRFTPRSVVSDTFKLIDLNRGRGGELKIPTMVVIAAKDQVNDNAAMESFYDSLTCEKKLLTLDNSGHNMQVDYQWEELSDEILKFFDSLED